MTTTFDVSPAPRTWTLDDGSTVYAYATTTPGLVQAAVYPPTMDETALRQFLASHGVTTEEDPRAPLA